MTTNKEPSLPDLISELDAATRCYEDAKSEAARLRKLETEARNRLNKAQAAIDRAVQSLKDGAPQDSDWKQARERTA